MRGFVLGITFLAACGGVSADAPLTVKLGAPRAEAIESLRTQKFCFRPDGPPRRTETYPRCDRTGSEWGEAWVTVSYDNAGTLAEVKRFERYADDNRAIERWNQLIQDRMKLSPKAEDAGDALRARGPLEAGTRSVKAFLLDDDTIVAVYLLSPTPPEQASVLEAIVRARR